jgi:hypothetical protein
MNELFLASFNVLTLDATLMDTRKFRPGDTPRLWNGIVVYRSTGAITMNNSIFRCHVEHCTLCQARAPFAFNLTERKPMGSYLKRPLTFYLLN